MAKFTESEKQKIEAARRAYNQRTGGRGVKVKFQVVGDNVLLLKPRIGESIALYSPSTNRFLDPRIQTAPVRGTLRYRIEEKQQQL